MSNAVGPDCRFFSANLTVGAREKTALCNCVQNACHGWSGSMAYHKGSSSRKGTSTRAIDTATKKSVAAAKGQ